MEFSIPDPSKLYQSPGMVQSKSAGTISSLQKEDGQRGLLVDRGVGSPRLVKSFSSSTFTTDISLDTDTKVCIKDFHSLCIIQIYFQWTNLYCIKLCQF